MSKNINLDRRRFLGTVAMTIAAPPLGMIGSADAQSSKVKPPGMPTIKPGTHRMTPAAVQLPIEGELPSLGRATGWLNSQPLTAAGLHGKVALIDVWTIPASIGYARFPMSTRGPRKYKDRGLVVIGVHSPEFAFEKNIDNVRRAAKNMKVDYPIAIDNNYAIWRALKNEFWPALYFVDAIRAWRLLRSRSADSRNQIVPSW